MKWRKSDESEIRSEEDIILDSIIMDEDYNSEKRNDDSFELKLNDDVFAFSDADNELIQRETEKDEFSFVVNEDVFELSEAEIKEAEERDALALEAAKRKLSEEVTENKSFKSEKFDFEIEASEYPEDSENEDETSLDGDEYIKSPNGYKADLEYFLGLSEEAKEGEYSENNSNSLDFESEKENENKLEDALQEDALQEASGGDNNDNNENNKNSADGFGEVSFWKHVDIKNKITDQQKNFYISLGVITATVLLVGLIIFFAVSPFGRDMLDNIFFGNSNKTENDTDIESHPSVTPMLSLIPENTPIPSVSVTPTLTPTMTPTPTKSSWRPTPTPTKIIYSMLEPKHEDDIFNILLIGVENLDENGVLEVGSKGEADSIMLASVNKTSGDVVLCSVLRDIWVTIPGRDDAKLCYAYELGGASILEQTFETNFKVEVDAYARFDFTAFEQVIDMLGGVDVSLTAAEAKYLNKTNYISDPMQRTVVPGIQTLSGNQALGYCRIKAVETSSGSNGDFGRTERQRNIIKALVNKYKSKPLTELLGITENMLSMITTSATKEQITQIVTSIVEAGSFTVEAKKLPSAGNYRVTMMKGQEALVVDFEETIPELYRYIFGEIE